QVEAPFSPFGEQARFSEEVGGQTSRQRVHGSREPHGNIVERGNRNRGFFRERLHSGSNRNVRMLDCEGVQGLLAVPHSRPSGWSGKGLPDVGWGESNVCNRSDEQNKNRTVG